MEYFVSFKLTTDAAQESLKDIKDLIQANMDSAVLTVENIQVAETQNI